jgi:uncharacterized protein
MNDCPLRIDKDGRWFYRQEEITHRRTYLLFSHSLTRDVSGRLVIRIGQEECPVEVEDTPFVVRTLTCILTENGGLKSVILTLNDETQEVFDPLTLRIGPENIPYCRVRDGMFDARFSRAAYQLLLPFVQFDEKENFYYILIASRKYNLEVF